MALINCRECGKQVAHTAKTCPHCGVEQPDGRAAGVALVMKLVIVGAVGFGIYSCTRSAQDVAPASPADNGRIAALTLCQQAITRAAANPSSAHVPYAKDYGGATEHYFAWPKGSGLTMMNALGAHIDTPASCITTPDGKTIIDLTIAGQTIIESDG